MWSVVTDAKRGERVETIAGLPIGRVPQGLSSCFWELLSSPHIDSIDWKERTKGGLAGAIFTSPIQLELISHDIVIHPISSVYP